MLCPGHCHCPLSSLGLTACSKEDPRDDVRDPQQHVFCNEALGLGTDGEQMGCVLRRSWEKNRQGPVEAMFLEACDEVCCCGNLRNQYQLADYYSVSLNAWSLAWFITRDHHGNCYQWSQAARGPESCSHDGSMGPCRKMIPWQIHVG